MNQPARNPDPSQFAVVTGGGSGIGRALCQRLSVLGWSVAVVDIDGQAAEKTLAQLPSPSSESLAFAMDVADPAAWDRLITNLRDCWPRLDLLVNNAGVLIGGPLADASREELRRLIDVNLLGPMLGSHAAAPWLLDSAAQCLPTQLRPADRRSPRPGIINTASIFAALAPPEFAAYSASKAAMVALSESLRGELAGAGLNVTVALPGAVPTQLFSNASFSTAATAKAAKRFADQAELSADVVAAQMLSAASRGQLYAVIGRRSRWYARIKRWLPEFMNHRIASRTRQELTTETALEIPPSCAAPLTPRHHAAP